MDSGKNMSFLDHLEELRWRLVRSAIVIVIAAVVIWVFQEWILNTLFFSMKNPDFFTFKILCQTIGVCVEEIPVNFQSTTVTGQFSYAIMMSILGGIVVSFPYIFYQLWSFIKPGLKQTERGIAGGIVFYVSMLFFMGIAFGYFIVAPLCVQFFGNYQMSESIDNIFTIGSYMSLVLSTVFYSGLLFLLPVVTYLFTKLGVLTPEFLKKYRKHAVVGILILSAFITPPDLISQVIVGIPILLLYEVGIIISKRVVKKRKKAEES
ncbi:MAG: twin-arginine translocase subunit TatC [Crocinitomicaceae bacterium]|jgi:sec-independent protein translocase protein TatC|nr:twin-arginine translocase subunit TatC [Crocinitomicaceae bacterium]MDG1659134.1 twin-arginine translocase subunit TatC [Crocinitomicaceae bacterium]|tara:strand:- start:3708 stop:4499 length:792 start_codon:yes stop_codon:yes gene_type:complete